MRYSFRERILLWSLRQGATFRLKFLTEELRRILTYVGPEGRRLREVFISFVLPKVATTAIETLPQVKLILNFLFILKHLLPLGLVDPVVGCYWLSHVLRASS